MSIFWTEERSLYCVSTKGGEIPVGMTSFLTKATWQKEKGRQAALAGDKQRFQKSA
jgi:hypothetical protein